MKKRLCNGGKLSFIEKDIIMLWKPIGIASSCVATAYITKNYKENFFEIYTYHSLCR